MSAPGVRPGGLIDRLIEPMAALTDEQQIAVGIVEQALEHAVDVLCASCPHGSRYTSHAIDHITYAMDDAVRAIRHAGEA